MPKRLNTRAAKLAPSFAETRARTSKSEASRFANPLDPLFRGHHFRVKRGRVGDSARFAWHVFVEVSGEEWYEILVDAQNGELLLRHNLYLDQAQGTVYTESPNAGARVLALVRG